MRLLSMAASVLAMSVGQTGITLPPVRHIPPPKSVERIRNHLHPTKGWRNASKSRFKKGTNRRPKPIKG